MAGSFLGWLPFWARQEAASVVRPFVWYALAPYLAVLFLSICLWWALGNLIGHGWSALVVAALWGLVGAALYASGRKKLREVHPTPERTVNTLKNVPDALKGQVGDHR